MDELGLSFLVAFCFPVIQTQGIAPQDLNTLLRRRQEFPGQVERSFFSPGVGTRRFDPSDPRSDTRRFDPSDRGMFTVDRHLEVPSTSVARGHSRFGMEGSRQGRTETTHLDQFKAAGIHGGIPGAMDHGGSRGVAHGQLEASSQAQLDASGQTDITVEGEAMVPTRLLAGGQIGGVTVGDGMGLEASRQGQFGSAGQAATLNNVDRRLQGQLEASNQAELAAGSQGEVTVAGELAVPTQVLDTARRVQGGIGAGGETGVNTQLAGTQTGEISGSRAADISASRGGTINSARAGEMSGFGAGEISGTRAGEISSSRTGEINGSMAGEISGSRSGEISGSRAGEISGVRQGEISGSRAGQLSGSQSGEIGGSRAGEISGSQTGEKSGSRIGEIVGSREGQLNVGRDFQLSGSREGSFSGSQEGQSWRQLDHAFGGQSGITDKQAGVMDRRGLGTFTEGALSATNQADVRAGGQGEVTIEGEVAIPSQMLNAAGGSFRRDSGGLTGSRTRDITGAQQFDASGQKRLDATTGRQADVGTREQGSSLGGRLLDFSGLDVSSQGQGQMSTSRESQLSASRDARLGLSRDTTITGPRGGQIETSRKAGLGLSRDAQTDVARERGIASGQTGQLSAFRDRDVRLGLSRDTTITGPRGGHIETSRTAGLGLSRDAQLDVARERGIAAGQIGQQSASRDRDVRLGQSRDTTITGPRGGQIETSRKAGLGLSRDAQIDVARQRDIAGGQTGQLSASRDRDIRLGLSRDTTITGPRGGQIETSRNAGLGLSRDTQLGVARERDLAAGQLPVGGMREGQLSASNQVDLTAGGQGEITVEGEIAVPRRALNAAGQMLDGGLRRDRVGFGGDRRLDLSGSRQTDLSGQARGQAELSGQQTMTGLGGRSIDLTGLGQVDQGIGVSTGGSVDVSGQGERTVNRGGLGKSEIFPGLGQRIGGMGAGQRIGKGGSFEISRVSVNVRCYADPLKGLSCGVEYPDDQCKEKWDFPNPCTRENMDMNITKFVHPYDNSKFLMCGEMGKLYIVQCPRLEIFHAGCGQCVDENVGLTASCEEPLPPQTSNPCTRQNIIDNKLFFGYPGNLSKFIHCDVWGKPWVRECTRGEVWNQWDVSCVQPSLINPCSRLNADLAYLYPHPCNPKRYIRCDQHGDAYEDICGWNEAFNEATQYCDPVGSFYGSDRPAYCADYIFGFKHYRDRGTVDPGFGHGGSRVGSPQDGTRRGTDIGGGQTFTTNRGPERIDLGQGINGKPVLPNEGVTNLAGTITIHRSKLRTYIYRKGEQYAAPCITDNIKEGRYHFRVRGDPHSFIQCDDHGFSHIIACPGAKGGPKDYFDPWTNTCVDGPVHVDNQINGFNG